MIKKKNNLPKKLLVSTIILTLIFIALSSANAAEHNITNTTSGGLNKTVSDANDGDRINLGTGIYTNNVTSIIIDKNLTIVGKNKEATIINAQQLERIFDITSTGSLTLINITLTNGNADNGGTMYNEGGKVAVQNCIFTNNSVRHYGGAIYNDGGTTSVIGSIFNNNNAISGGGAIATSYDIGTIIIDNSTFSNNQGNPGGAIYNTDDNTLTINNSIFTNNIANSEGGAILNYADSMTITNSLFINNTAEYSGGAIQNFGGININITNSTFTNNNILTDDFDGGGGAISNYYNENVNILDSTFNSNTANSRGGAIYNVGVENINITNSNFTKNTANDTGAIYNEDVINMNIIGCNIINNSQGIYINSDSENITINYNRIFNNTEYDLNNNAIDTNADYNWWGSNNPEINKIIGITLNNHFVMNVTNLTSLDSNGTVIFQYSFKLNTGETADNNLLPYFLTNVYTNIASGAIESFDARFDKTFNITLDKSGNVTYTFITDNEVQNLEGTVTLPPTPPVPTIPPKPPEPTPTPEPNNNGTSNNPTAQASMKSTGLPINLLLILLSVLGFSFYRKQ
ncbi:putative outer membrane protein pmp20 precursor [Methanobrevibacter cuticularis]|uniref:Putative outer membrane protein pmp20 n=1 Tax=Methanobrevibacter cuticularis TaxID=47311 RepID=A0A166CRM6_9EURY|nr:hypothetical protein [Methanobrevibacter cuticularis]KZX16287.1 putative outer membrane protein pmp20 precursor [Methanobrevibacter cuticularis]